MAIRRSRLAKSTSRGHRRKRRGDDGGSRRLLLESLEQRMLLAVGPQLIGIQPNNGSLLNEGDIRNIAPVDLTFRFDQNSVIDPNTLSAVQLTRSVDGVFGNGNDVLVQPGFLGLGDVGHEVIMRFAARLPDDSYRIDVIGSGPSPLRNVGGDPFNDGQDFQLNFELDLGAQIIAAVPQPVTRNAAGQLTQRRDQILIYLNDDDLDPASAQNPAFYQLFFTSDTATNTDDARYNPNPAQVQYDPVADTVLLTFANDIERLGSGPGTFRLRIGTDEPVPPPPVAVPMGLDPGSSFATANISLGTLGGTGTESKVVSESIQAQSFPLDFPGAISEPGHRDIPVESHVNRGADGSSGIATRFYNFQDNYGFDPAGNPLFNLITEAQKARAREIFELYGYYLGIQFVETDNLGFTIVTGDLRALSPDIPTGPGGVAGIAGGNLAIMDNAESWNDAFGANWFQVAMHEIGHLLGLGHSYELPQITVQGDTSLLTFGNRLEPDFPGDADIFHGQYLYRPESKDVDLYRFDLADTGVFSAEVFAERLPNSSLLDSVVTLYREVPGGRPELIARNDDYYSEDSFMEIPLEPGRYYIGVSASGNESYDPVIPDTGIGGTTQGVYNLRLTFRPDADQSIVDADNPGEPTTALDGDNDGIPGGVYNFWFRAAAPVGQALVGEPHTIFVDKSAPAGGTGSLLNPLNNISVGPNSALSVARPGDVVRIVGNGGDDNNLATLGDNLAFEIGFDSLGRALSDGSTMSVPKGVTVMIDAGAIFKLRRARIGVGSSTLAIDRSASALQVLGTPLNSVIFTSYNDESIGRDTNPFSTVPVSGDWGGLVFRQDLDRAEERFIYERQGIFLDYVNHADIRYGGGTVVVDSQQQIITPIHMTRARPTISYNRITRSADSAMSADPDSFEETNFHSPRFQLSASYTSDYERVGPDIDGNTLLNNSTNALFVRVQTPAGNDLRPLTVAGRWDDTDIVHYMAESLRIQGTPGGPFLEVVTPPVELIVLTPQDGGTLTAGGTYNYRLVFVDANGNESPPSNPTRDAQLVGAQRSILLSNLPPVAAPYVARRLYRSDDTGDTGGVYTLVADIDASDTTYLDDGTTAMGELNTAVTGLQRARLDARLAIDPGTIVKLEGARFEVGVGAQFIAEGRDGQEVIFTSKLDDRFGGSGTFDTNNDNSLGSNESVPTPGDWGGIYVGHASTASIDHALVTFGGGINKIEGTFTGFNALEIHQAKARVAHSVFESNASGMGGQGPASRFGRGFNESAAIFVRGAQPIIVDNIIRGNIGPAININTNALNFVLKTDYGRSTGVVDRFVGFRDNQGPLIRLNRLANNSVNGMKVRAETLTTEGVWDDTDIVHVVYDTIYVPDFHTYGGLQLESSATQSLVVKLSGPDAGFTATGRPLDIDDRIGGMLQIVGQPGVPVTFTSLADDTVGAGFSAETGETQTDTNNDADASEPQPGDWRSIRLDQFSHDRNVEVILELEPPDVDAPGPNALPDSAQEIGALAPYEKAGDDNLRLGFNVQGFLNSPNDVDVYSFNAQAGVEVWFDIDRTTHALDTVVELIDAAGTVIARSDNSLAEQNQTETLVQSSPLVDVNILQKSPYLPEDRWTTNPRDAGMRVVLPGTVGSPSTYFVRVRSSSPNLDTDLQGGLTSGVYELQIRLRELDEFPGSTIRFADIRYATDGIEVLGMPVHSPLLGEVVESGAPNDSIATAQPAGNVLNTDRAALGIAGVLASATDVDFYQFEVTFDSVQRIGGVTAPQTLATVFDLDYADGMARANTSLYVFDSAGNLVLSATDSNIAEDRPGPLEGSDVDDLSRGTVGALDPYIGVQELPEGTYYVAVASDAVVPRELEQYLNPTPANPLVRLEPINSLPRIVEDRIGSSGGSGIATDPQIDILLDPVESVVPYHLGDVVLYISQDVSTGTRLQTVDPFTGTLETTVGGWSQFVGDIVMRNDGQLYTFSHFSPGDVCFADANADDYLLIDTGNGAVTLVGNHGIQTFNETAPGSQQSTRSNVCGGTAQGWGMRVEAMAYGPGFASGPNRLFIIGNRPFPGNTQIGSPGVEHLENVLYQLDQDTGVAFSAPANDRTGNALINGAGTQIVERGGLSTTSSEIATVEATEYFGVGPTTPLILDGTTFQIDGRTFEMDSGPDVLVQVDQPNGMFVRDGNFFFLDSGLFQFDTGSVIVFTDDGSTIADGSTLTIVNNQSLPVTFEFEDLAVGDGRETNGSVLIIYDSSTPTSRAQLATTTVSTINSVVGFNVVATRLSTATQERISLVNDLSVNLNAGAVLDTSLTALTQFGPVGFQTIVVPPTGGAGIVDGEIFTIDDGDRLVTFELDDLDSATVGVNPGNIAVNYRSGSDTADQVALSIAAAIQGVQPLGVRASVGSPINGQVQLSTGITIEGETGLAPMVRTSNGVSFADGQLFQLSVFGAPPVTFEFDQGNGVAATNVPIVVSVLDSAAQVAQKIADAVNQNTRATATNVGDIVVFNGPQVVYTNVNSALQTLVVTDFIDVAETDSAEQIVQSIVTTMNLTTNIVAGSDGARVNFVGPPPAAPPAPLLPPTIGPGPVMGDFRGTPVMMHLAGASGALSAGGVSGGLFRVPVEFLAEDTASEIADRIQIIAHNTLFPSVTVGSPGPLVTANATVACLQPIPHPFTCSNTGTGGLLTGMAFSADGARLFAVSDQGGLYEITNRNSPGGAGTDFIANVGGLDIEFAGLTLGPPNVEGGMYRDTLFGVDTSGVVYAFDYGGNLQPIFVDGQSSIATGVTAGINGIAFSTLDRNLWHTTNARPRSEDPGHGIDPTFDNSRIPPRVFGNTSFQFGPFNFPGGAHGSLESNTFSLKGYTSADQPVLYFNYFAVTEEQSTAPNTGPMRDAIRVFITDDSGEWDLLTTNNSYRPDELSFGPNIVQEVFDNGTGWRQIRVRLDQYAGLENLRLRFDFSTAAEMNTGDPTTVGDELRAIAGSELRDQQIFTVDGVDFEFDLGYTLVVPTGAAIADGSRFTINGVSFEFDNGTGGPVVGATPVPYSASQSAATVAQTMEGLIAASGFTTILVGNRLNLPTAGLVTKTPSSAALVIEGAPGVSAGSVPVVIDAGMTDQEVAAVIRRKLADVFVITQDINIIKTYREVVRVIGHSVTGQSLGPYGLTPLGLTNDLPGDEYGAFFSNLRGQNNNFEGVYIDDIIIGFAERGEMVTGTVQDNTFVTNPLHPSNQIDVGAYQLEIRRGAQYGRATEDGLVLLRAFDTNDRLTHQVTFAAPAAYDIADGQTFQISDGVDTVIFEFDDVDLPVGHPRRGVSPGHIRVPFDAKIANSTAQADYVIAATIRDEINSQQSQAVLDVTAALSDGEVFGPRSTSPLINLFGNATGDVFPTFDFGDIAPIAFGAGEHGFIGDQNLFRDQGQILIHSNYVTNSAGFGILADAGARDRSDIVPGAGVLPHAGPVRNLRELNNQRLAPGVTIANNVVAYNQQGGIQFSGDPNAGGAQLASVPFGRIINNTVFGDAVVPNQTSNLTDIVILFDTSGSMGDDMNEVKARIPLLNTALVGAGINAQYALVEFPLRGDSMNNPGLTQDVVNFTTFIQPGGPFDSLDATGGPVERGSLAVREAFNDFLPSTTVNFRAGSTPAVILITDEPDNSANADFLAADMLLSTFNGVFHAIASPNLGNTQATYGTLAANHGGQLFDIRQFRMDPGPFFTAFIASFVNSLSGSVTGAGIQVRNNASPTILNNILSGLVTGIDIDASSASTVLGGTLFKGNNNNSTGTLGDFPIILADSDPLFVNPRDGNFYPAPGSLAIDSSIDSLEDRAQLVTVRDPLGIPVSPILAPDRDVTGQLRSDDPSVPTPAGQGANVFKDRGALDRVDFVGPTALLIAPRDNDADGVDTEPAETVVRLPASAVLSNFEIQLVDGVPPADARDGIGIDDTSVTVDQVTITSNGRMLVPGVDYVFTYNETSDTIRLTPLAGIWPTNRLYVITVNNDDRFIITPPDGSVIKDGDTFEVTDEFGNSVDFEFDSGYRIQVPATLALQVPMEGAGAGGVGESETFTIINGANAPVTFEFDGDGSFNPLNRIIPISSSDSQAALAQKIIAAINAVPLLELSPRDLGGGKIHLGSTSAHVLITSLTKLSQTGQAAGVEDAQTFTVDDGTKLVTFEFEDTNIGDGVTAGNVRIDFTLSNTNLEIADKIVLAIRNAGVGLDTYHTHRGDEPSPTHLGNGLIHVGGTVYHILNTSNSRLLLSGRPGVAPPFGIKIPTRAGAPVGITDGQSFAIGDGTGPLVQFELDSNNSVTAGRVRIPFTSMTGQQLTVDELADEIVAAIQGAGLGLAPRKIFDVAGLGAIALGGNSSYVLNTSLTVLSNLGTAGDPGAIPVVVSPIPSFDATQVAVALIGSINGSPLQEVRALPGGGAKVVLEGVSNQTDFSKIFTSNLFASAVKDLAGNELKPNQLSGETQFSILMGNVNLDFGDAPDGIGISPQDHYPTLFGSNGPIHVMPQTPVYFLGASIDAELEGQSSLAADGDDILGIDDEDGVTGPGGSPIPFFNPFVDTEIQVTASTAGLLDAWIDFNRDGDWEDPGEQVFASRQLVAGANLLTIHATPDSKNGETFARFRFTQSGGTRATGLVAGGEVEDYVVVVEPGTPPVAVDDPAVAGDSNYRVSEDSMLNVNPAVSVLTNDMDADGDSLVVSPAGSRLSADGAAVIVNSDGTFSYDPTGLAVFQALGDQPGQTSSRDDTFTYRAFDGKFASNEAHVTITVLGVNDAPQAVADNYPISGSLLEGGMLATTDPDGKATPTNPADDGVLANDLDPEGDNLTAELVMAPIHHVGTFTLNPNGTFTYVHDGSEVLTDTFTYRAVDEFGEVGNTVVVTLTITEVNDNPVAVNDTYSVNEGGLLTVNDADGTATPANNNDNSILLNDTDAENDVPFTAMLLTQPSHGTLSNFDPSNGTFQYQHNGGEELTDSFTYRITDSRGGVSAMATVTIDIIPVNDNPVAVDDSYLVDEGKALVADDALGTNTPTTNDNGVIANDSDVDTPKGSLQAILVTPPAHHDGSFVLNSNGTFTYKHDGGSSTSDSFTYRLNDGAGGTSNVATVQLTITQVNDPPTAVDDSYTVAEGATLTANDASGTGTPANPNDDSVLVNDFDEEGDSFVAVLVTPPVHHVGTFTLNADGTFTYVHDGTETTSDSFTYRASDGQLGNLATVNITITPQNDPPVALNDSYKMTPGGTLVTTDPDGQATPTNPADDGVLANDTDAEGDSLTAVLVTPPSNAAAFTLNPNGTFTYTPNAGSFIDTFTYRANDGASDSNLATVTINVNSPPVAVDDNLVTVRNVPGTIDVLDNDIDPDGTLVPSTVTIVDKPAIGNAVVNGDGSITYTPQANFVGTTSFTYTVADNDGAVSNKATVTVDVILNPAPHRNPLNRLDINADGEVSPIDALILINYINFNGATTLPVPPRPPLVPPPFLDPNGDNIVDVSDVALVINHLNRQGSGEGEAPRSVETVQPLAVEAIVQPAASGTSNSQLVSGAFLGSEAGKELLAGQANHPPATSTVTSADSGRTSEDQGDDLVTGVAQQPAAPLNALRSSVKMELELEDLLDDLVGDVAGAKDDQVAEDIALDELLRGV